jgi:hypothetical protein
MKVELAIPVDWTTTRVEHEGRERLEIDGGLSIELDEPIAGRRDGASMIEALAARDPIDGTTLERAGHVTSHTTEGVPFSLSSIKLRDATNAVVEGRLIAFYDFGDVVATVSCRMRGRDVLARFGPAIEPLLASARLDRGTEAPRIDDLLR